MLFVFLSMTIFAQESVEAAHAAGRRRLTRTLSEACRDDGRKSRGRACLHRVPRKHWPQIASTNPIERVNGEANHRTDVVGIFPNERAIIRPGGALVLEQTDGWPVTRRYMTLESLEPMSNDPIISLPAAAA
jgi:putative transposase